MDVLVDFPVKRRRPCPPQAEHDESGNTGDVGALIDVNAYGSPGAQDAARILRRARSGGKAEAEAKD